MQSLATTTLRSAAQAVKQLARPLAGAAAAQRPQSNGIDLWRVTQKSCSTMISLNQAQSGDLRKRVLVTHLLKKVYSVSVEMLKGKGPTPPAPQHAMAKQQTLAAVTVDAATPPAQEAPAAVCQGESRKVRRRSIGLAFKGLFGKRSSPKLDPTGAARGDSSVV